MDRDQRTQRLLDWLSFMPSLENVARALVLDYFSSFIPIKSMIWHLTKNDSLILLASYGDQETPIGKSISGSVWRNGSIAAPLALQATSRNPTTWFENDTQVVINLYAQGLLIGFLLVGFAESVDTPENFTSYAEEISCQISLYLALQFYKSLGLDNEVQKSNGALATGTANTELKFTTRQASILSGIVAKKTNHAIAKELGYSASTIRHETMRIFKALGVSDRVAAASKAHKLGLHPITTCNCQD